MTTLNYTSPNRKSQLQNKLKHGVGYNSGRTHLVLINKKNNPVYTVWCNMINRCYAKNNTVKNESYKDCTVSDQWHDYQDFADWYINHDYYGLGYFLDKDILLPNNKIYSPEACCLVPIEINNLFIDRRGDRGDFPIGVTYHPKTGKFVSRLSTSQGRVYLGLHKTPQEAHRAYVIAKEAYVKEVANEWRGRIDERVYRALMGWVVINQ